jgi:hypothetical protein
MILSLFIILLAISFILIFLGYQTKEGSYYMLGFAFIFILGSTVLLPGNLQLPEGSITAYNYSCACCIDGVFTQGGTTYNNYCSGEPRDCDYYDLNELDCIAAGCSYNETICYGTPSPCNTFYTERECNLVNCTWNSEPSQNSCTNSTMIISSETITPQYTSLDSFLTHFFGFWITMLGIVGFIISMGDIKRGIPK